MADQFDTYREPGKELLSRRKFLELSGVYIALGYLSVNHGVRLFPPDTVERYFGSKEVPYRDITYEEILMEYRLILDDWDFFVEGQTYKLAHRAGNRPEAIDLAVKVMHANYIDIDANYAYREVHTEHGMIKRAAWGLLNVVGDLNEGELRDILPQTFEQSIDHISGLRSKYGALGVNIDFKHGNFDSHARDKILSILQKYHMPATFQPGKCRAALIGDYEKRISQQKSP